jgi:hypothetical protein
MSRFKSGYDKPTYLMTCYMTGATEGRNLGTAGYSHDFVAKLFAELLSQRGEVLPVANPEKNLDEVAKHAIARGRRPVHFSVLPLQDVPLCSVAPNIAMPAWEFPDVPDHAFNNNPKNNWIPTANGCEMLMVGGEFTVDALRRGGVTSPIRIVPVPTPTEYFDVDFWQAGNKHQIDVAAYWPTPKNVASPRSSGQTRRTCLKQASRDLSRSFKNINKAIIGPEAYEARAARRREARQTRRDQKHRISNSSAMQLPYPRTDKLNLSGIVYTSIFNPDDGRKNWCDLVNGLLLGVGEREDVTLVFKLITKRREAAELFVNYIQDRQLPRRCKVAVVVDFLSDSQLHQLAAASTFYVQTTRAEGNCLPLMNYLGAGRPGISPRHSAIADYFNDDYGWTIDSFPEPAAWPHDPQYRLRTSWGRIVFPSIVEQVAKSYELVTTQPHAYRTLAEACRSHMRQWASPDAVRERLMGALDELEGVAVEPRLAAMAA